MEIFPLHTPSEYNKDNLSSTPGAPLGHFVKSSAPCCFCLLKVNGQWSVATVSISLFLRPSHNASLSAGFRSGGAITAFNPSDESSYKSSVSNRYCGQVSTPICFCPRFFAWRISSNPSFVERCTMYTGASPIALARYNIRFTASASASFGLLNGWYLTSVFPSPTNFFRK